MKNNVCAVVVAQAGADEGECVRVMQMNVLADRWAPPSAFPHTDPAALPWWHRKDLLVEQILRLNPDVVGLEVTCTCAWSEVQVQVRGRHQCCADVVRCVCRRSTTSRITSSRRWPHTVDALRTLWDGADRSLILSGWCIRARRLCGILQGKERQRRHRRLRSLLQVLQVGDPPSPSRGPRSGPLRPLRFDLVAHKGIDFEDHSQVAQIVRLRLRSDSSREVCVSVTHLKAKEGFEEKRLEEGILLLRSAADFIQAGSNDEQEASRGGSGSKQPPLVVLGDFNDVPSSLVCSYFRGETLPLSSEVPLHPFLLRSAYALHPIVPGDEDQQVEEAPEKKSPYEPYSTYKKRETEVRRTIDYVWYSARALVPLRLLQVPSPVLLPERLPCLNHPSDHLALCADLAWLP